MQSKIEAYDELTQMIQDRDEIIQKQEKTIIQLANQNAEQENMINELMKELVP